LPIHETPFGYELRVIDRCLLDDLNFRQEDLGRPLADLASGDTDGAAMLRTFLDKRGKAVEPDDEDVLDGLATGPKVPMPAWRRPGPTPGRAKQALNCLPAGNPGTVPLIRRRTTCGTPR
jgi:hypothetical protein